MTFDDYRYLLKKARDLLRENINPSQVNVCAIAEALVWADGRLGDEVAANDKLDAELAELKEKYRWHDSRVEKIPQSVSILHCPVYEIRAVLPSGSSHLFEAVMIAEDLICEAKNFDYYYWRLLDELPKEDVRP